MKTWEVMDGVCLVASAETVSAMEWLFDTAEHEAEIFSAVVHASMHGDEDYAEALLESLALLRAYREGKTP